MIKVFVGTDDHMGKSDRALENSIRSNTTAEVDITWMRYGDPGWEWNMGRGPGKPYGGKGWATDFTCFRFAVPELCEFKGKAIYLDTDMILLNDIERLWEKDCGSKACLIPYPRWDVILWDFANWPTDAGRWPTIEKMVPSGAPVVRYSQMLQRFAGGLSHSWNCLDGRRLNPQTNLIHFTNMRTQPWKPYPYIFDYPPHPCPEACDLFWAYANQDRPDPDHPDRG